MKLLKTTLLCFMLASLFACSKIKQWHNAAAEPDTESAITGDFEEADGENLSSDIGDLEEDQTLDETMSEAQQATEEYADIESQPTELTPTEELAPQPVEANERNVARLEPGNAMETYVVQENDTLMWIAFKLYGDYLQWRQLLQANPGLPKNGLSTGMKLSYQAPAEKFNWRPSGTPYRIVQGDTLGIISNKVYGTNKKWRGIWEHNRVMIKDPHLIFAGFTLHYLADDNLALNK